MKSTLVVGLGGTGVFLLRRLKALGSNQGSPWSLLGFDHAKSGTRQVNDSRFPCLGDDEFVWISGQSTHESLAGISGKELQLPWLPPKEKLTIAEELSPTSSGNYRWLGRLSGALAQEDLIRPNLQAAFRRLTSSQGWPEGHSPKSVIVAGSLAGGLASGMLIDMTILLASLATEVTRLAYLLLPQASFESLPRSWGNTYGSLREMVHLRDGLEWQGPPSYRPDGMAGSGGELQEPWQRIYLFSPFESEDSPYLSSIDCMARALVAPMHPVLRDATLEEIEHQILLLRGDRAVERNRLCFSSSSAMSLGSPLGKAIFKGPCFVETLQNIPVVSERLIEKADRYCLEVAAQERQTELVDLLRSQLESISGRVFDESSKELKKTADEMRKLCQVVQYNAESEGGEFRLDHDKLKSLVTNYEWKSEVCAECISPGALRGLLNATLKVPTGRVPIQSELGENWGVLEETAQKIFDMRYRWRRFMISEHEARQNIYERANAMILILERADFRRDLTNSLESLILAESKEAGRAERELPPPSIQPESALQLNGNAAETVKLPSRSELEQAIHQQLRRDVFIQRGPQTKRFVYALILLPDPCQGEEHKDFRAFIQRTVQDSLQCRCRIIFHSGPELWVYYEDLFHAAADIRHLPRFREGYLKHPRREIFHLDYRLLQDPGFPDLLEPPKRERASCGNRGCQANIVSVPRDQHLCPDCKALIRSRCGNPKCEAEDLHEHPQWTSKKCPSCNGLNRGAWWICSQHDGVETLISINKESCPDCILRHHEDPGGFPLSSISRRPDLRQELCCPRCLTLKTKEPRRTVFVVRNDLLPFYRNGVNGVDRDDFLKAAEKYQLVDGFRCPQCCTVLIPVDRRPDGPFGESGARCRAPGPDPPASTDGAALWAQSSDGTPAERAC